MGSDGCRSGLKERDVSVTSRVGGNFDQSELLKGEERIGLSLCIVEVGRYKEWPFKGNSGRCANGQV